MITLELNASANQLSLIGRLDRTQASRLCQQEHYGLAPEVKLIELSQLEYIDSAGVALLLEWHQIHKKRNKSLKFEGMNEQFKQLLVLYDLNDLGFFY